LIVLLASTKRSAPPDNAIAPPDNATAYPDPIEPPVVFFLQTLATIKDVGYYLRVGTTHGETKMNFTTEQLSDQAEMLETILDMTDGLFNLNDLIELTGWGYSRAENAMGVAFSMGLIEESCDDCYSLARNAEGILNYYSNPQPKPIIKVEEPVLAPMPEWITLADLFEPCN